MRNFCYVLTFQEGKEILGDEQVGETRAQTKVIKETAEGMLNFNCSDCNRLKLVAFFLSSMQKLPASCSINEKGSANSAQIYRGYLT